MRKVHPRTSFEPSATHRERGKEPRRASFYVTSKTKKTLFAIFVVGLFALAAIMLARSAEKGVPLDATATPVRVSMSGFTPSALTAKVGTPLRIDLINMDNQYHTDGGGWHDFVVEAFRMNISVEPLGQQIFTFPTDTPGTYTWYCDVCCGGKENPSMIGTVRVDA